VLLLHAATTSAESPSMAATPARTIAKRHGTTTMRLFLRLEGCRPVYACSTRRLARVPCAIVKIAFRRLNTKPLAEALLDWKSSIPTTACARVRQRPS
jgi:hypothetical protein